MRTFNFIFFVASMFFGLWLGLISTAADVSVECQKRGAWDSEQFIYKKTINITCKVGE